MLFPHCFSASSHRVTLTALAVLLAGSIAAPAAAQTVPTAHEKQIGVACKNAANLADFDTLAQCTSTGTTAGTFQKAPLFVGAVTSPPYAAVTCDAAKAGMIQYAASTMQYCNGTSWTTIGTAGAGSLGTAATAASPARSGDAGTGLFSATASTVSIATAGVERLTVTATGSVGIGTTGAVFQLTNSALSNVTGSFGGLGGGAHSLLWEHPSSDTTAGYAAGIANSYSAAGANGLLLKTADATSSTNIFEAYSGSSTRFLVRGDGNVGIGTTAPVSRLHVNEAAANAIITVSAPLANQSSIYLNDNTNGTDWAIYRPNGTRDLAFWNPTVGAALTISQTTGAVKYGTGMVSGWPDAITCHNGANFWLPFYLSNWTTGGTKTYRNLWNASGDMYIIYNNDGTYNSNVNADSYDCVSSAWTISALVSGGRAFLTVRPM